jgi:hypothetical protein
MRMMIPYIDFVFRFHSPTPTVVLCEIEVRTAPR